MGRSKATHFYLISLMFTILNQYSQYFAWREPYVLDFTFNNKNFIEKVSKLDKTKPYIVYCASGNRSLKASIIMEFSSKLFLDNKKPTSVQYILFNIFIF